MIKYILKQVDDNTIIQFRRLVTPFFYVNLRSKIYKHTKTVSNYLVIPNICATTIQLPEGRYVTYDLWEVGKDKVITGKLRDELQKVIK